MNSKSKIMRNMLIGMIGAAICMGASWLSSAYGEGNVRNGYIQSNWPKMSYMRLEASLILSAVGIALYYVGLKDYIRVVKMMKHRRYPAYGRMAGLFEIGAVASLISYMFIESGYIMMAIVYKLLFGTSLMGADIISTTEGMFYYIAIPLLTYLVISIAGVSIPFMYFVYQGRLHVSRLCIIFNPLVMLGLGELLRLTKLYYLVDFAAAAVPFGYLLMMAAGMLHVSKMKVRKKEEEV